jgi:hypothetical protein
MLRDILTLQMFLQPPGKYDHPLPLNRAIPENRQRASRMKVPETVVSTDCSVDRMLTTLLEMGCRYFSQKAGTLPYFTPIDNS